jgi:hypothetical protein
MRVFIETLLTVCLLGKSGLNEFEEISMIGIKC